MRLATEAVHVGAERDASGAVSPPIHMSTTFEHPADAAELTGHLYSRYGNPTQDRLESALATLEGGVGALAYASGMAAGAALAQVQPTGSHVVLAAESYFSFRALARDFMPRWGLAVSIVDLTDLAAVGAAVRPETRLIWAETPSNPRLRVVDLAALSRLAHDVGALLAVDSTFATPALSRPLTLGADVVLHSTTKFIAGHSDVLGGALVIGDGPLAGIALRDRLRDQRTVLGQIAAPLSAWLTLRGLRTLPCRMEWCSRSTMRIAEVLAAHPAVERVHYPGLVSHPQHELAARQMSGGFGGVLAFEVAGGRSAALAAVDRLQLITSATSLGGVETLIEHRRSVEGADSPTPESLLRVSVGLEHPDDLIDDLLAALGR